MSIEKGDGKKVRFLSPNHDGRFEKEAISPTKEEAAGRRVDIPVIIKATKRNRKDVGEMFDDLIMDLGGYGKYQKRVVFLVILPMFFILAFVQCVLAFVLSKPADYWCSIPELSPDQLNFFSSGDLPVINTKNLAPWDNSSTPPGYSQCSMYATNFTQLFLENNADPKALQQYLAAGNHELSVTNCLYGWTYSTTSEHYDASVVTEWDIVCEFDYLQSIVNILFVCAIIAGIFAGGYCADRWGRKVPFFVFFAIFLIFGLSFAFAPTFEGFVILAMIHSFGIGPIYYILYTTGVELLTAASRVSFVIWLSVYYAAGSMVFTVSAYFFRQWRSLATYGTAPFFLVMFFWFFLPESPRWMLVTERFKQLERFLLQVSRLNGKPFNDQCQEKLKLIITQCEREVNLKYGPLSTRRASWTKLFVTGPMLRKTILLAYLLCTLQVVDGGLRSYTPPLGDTDKYFSYFLSSLVEIPGYALIAHICDRFGRRLSVMMCFLAAFLTCVVTLAFPSGNHYYWGIICVFFIARIFIAAAYVVGELLIYETYPTVIRVQGVCFCEAVATIVAHLGPQIVKLQFHSTVLPLIIFGCLSLLAVLCVFMLSETLSSALPETLEEADMRGVTFREAVNLRVPRVKVKPTVSVQYKKKDMVVGYVPVSEEKLAQAVKNDSMQHVLRRPTDLYANPPSPGTPIVVSAPADTLYQIDKPDAPPPLIFNGQLPFASGQGDKSAHVVGGSDIAKARASLKRTPRNDKIDADFDRDQRNDAVV